MWTAWVLLLLVGVAGIASANTLCPGAPEESYAPGSESCEPPKCTAGELHQRLLWPSTNPRTFYQCAPGHPVFTMHCAVGTCFSFSRQYCVNAYEWTNSCVDAAATTTTTTTTEEPTTTTTTEEPTTTTTTEEPTTTTTEEPTTTTTTEEPTTTTTEEPTTTTTTEEPTTTTTTEEPTTTTTTEEPTTTTTTEEPTTTTTEEPTTITTTEEPTTTTEEPTTTTTTTTEEPTTTTTEEPTTTTVEPPATPDLYTGNICKGVDPSTVFAGTEACEKPTCTVDLVESKRKLPSLLPNQYYDCLQVNVNRVINCASDRCFDYGKQKCVEKEEWTNYCANH